MEDKVEPGLSKQNPGNVNPGKADDSAALQDELANLKQELAQKNNELLELHRQLTQAREENSVLAKEVHHRVRNNLQLISNLISLQSFYLKDNSVIEIFENLHNRIKAMADVHESLHKSKHLGKIDFGKNVQQLVNNVMASQRVGGNAIAITVKAADIGLDIRTAVPCCLIINEMVANAVKHAFPFLKPVSFPGRDKHPHPDWVEGDNSKPKITVELRSDPDLQQLILEVGDNGVGLPPGFQLEKNAALGLRLVTGLSRQLKGTLEFKENTGTTFVIRFPFPQKK